MNKSKFILGILITILGGSIMLASMILGILHFAGSLYEDIQIFDIELRTSQAAPKTSLFTIKEEKIISVWFKYPNRQVENKNFKVAVSLVDENENIIAEFGEDFRFGYFRNSTGKDHYYKLGEYNFKKVFRGYMQYKIDGTWVPMKTGKIVLRQSLPLLLPVKQIGFFIAGLFMLVVSIRTIAKNSNKQITRQSSGR